MNAPKHPATRKRGLPAWVWAVYLLLFALSVPWYLPDSDSPALWLGLPYWVVLSLLACLGLSGFTAFVILRYWPEHEEELTRTQGPRETEP